MRNLYELNRYRRTDANVIAHWGWSGDETCGTFELPSPLDENILRVIASAGEGWDHVSVSRKNRCPNWQEMEFVARCFFKTSEHAMQLHLPEMEHVNNHPFCLHWWRPHILNIPLPPSSMVGFKSEGILSPLRAATLRHEINELEKKKGSL